MIDPRTEPIPDDPIAQIRAFAKDLAYGALVGEWTLKLRYRSREIIGIHPNLSKYLQDKWEMKQPSLDLLVSFNYISNTGGDNYRLTEKAFSLLEQLPPAPIFISYNRHESSAFALLLVARLKAVGLDPFLDIKDIDPGGSWHALLEYEIQQREYFICLIGPRTLDSLYVRKEIEWAIDAHARTIPIWHNGFKNPETGDYDEGLKHFLEQNAIIVENENAKAYNSAIVELLNYFGFTPS